ncbi:MAG: type II toxin-antitoxin system RelE/ParE family toxin [Lachnospiraceae bacterium]|nr:type II toxin-antitoxin system RelE/ParE family toxin [Lachnospiraceae bacterium]
MPKVKYDVRYLPLFYEELDRDVSYIAFKLKNPDAANDLLDSVESAIMKRLNDGPESFEQVYSRKSRNHPYYRIHVKNYIIYYVVLEEHGRKIMEVRRFMHSLEDRDNKI